jgi:hypothetical protein
MVIDVAFMIYITIVNKMELSVSPLSVSTKSILKL